MSIRRVFFLWILPCLSLVPLYHVFMDSFWSRGLLQPSSSSTRKKKTTTITSPWQLAWFAPSTTPTTCQLETQQRLASTELGGIQLTAGHPTILPRRRQQQQQDGNDEGMILRVPIYNLPPSQQEQEHRFEPWQYSLWGRLVGESHKSILPFSKITYQDTHTVPYNASHNLFAEVEFVVWEPDNYQLEIDVRYIWGPGIEVTEPYNMPYQYNTSALWDTNDPFPPHLLQQVSQGHIFPYSGNVAHQLALLGQQEVPILALARENDLESWRAESQRKNLTHWFLYHRHWVQHHCLQIGGSPYQLQIALVTNTTADIGDDNQRSSIPSDDATTSRRKYETNNPEKPILRTCDASDLNRRGYWRQVPVDCSFNVNNDNDDPYCNYLWRNDRENTRIIYAKCLNDCQHPPPVGWIFETPGCQWTFPNATGLQQCFADQYQNRLNLVGDSLIRMMHQSLQLYLKYLNLSNDFLQMGVDYKQQGQSTEALQGGHGFSWEEGGIFLDDFQVAHLVGWGHYTTVQNSEGKESSPGRLVEQLKSQQKWFEDQRRQHNASKLQPNFMYYVPNYFNEFRSRQGFEPFMSFYAALTGEFLHNELGYNIFDANYMLRGLVLNTGDGLHYDWEIVRFLVIIFLNVLCN